MDPAPLADATAAATAATIARLQAAMAALVAQRAVFGDAVVEQAMALLRSELTAELGSPP